MKNNDGIVDMEIQINNLLTVNKKLKNDKQQLYENYKAGIISRGRYRNLAEQLRESENKNGELLEELHRKWSVVTEKAEVVKEGGMFSKLTRELVDVLIETVSVYEENRIQIVWKHKTS